MDVEEFAEELLQDVLADSDADGEFQEDIFFQKSCELLMDAGELEARIEPRTGPPQEAYGWTGMAVIRQMRRKH